MLLNDVKVVEIGQAFAGPFASQILAHLGAEVVKVERAGDGDDARRWGPSFDGDGSAIFHALNGSKTSLALDLKDPDDLAALRAVLTEADVLVHNLRPGALARMGLGPEDLAKDLPRLIYAEISAFGHVGPMRDQPGYEILAQAFGGIMSTTGEPDRDPVRCGPSLCDFGSGMWLAIGILAALHRRAATGRGGLVQTSLYETALTWTTIQAAPYLASGEPPARSGASHVLIAPYGYFETATDPIMLACASDGIFRRLAPALDRPDWLEDPRFKDNAARVTHRATLEGQVAEIFAARDLSHWFEVLNAAGVPCSPVNTVPQALAHPQAEALGILQTPPDRPDVTALGLPLSFEGERPALRSAAPRLGSKPENTPAAAGE
ncbi:MAG: CoA transferase [Pseudomonadota bacterium]